MLSVNMLKTVFVLKKRFCVTLLSKCKDSILSGYVHSVQVHGFDMIKYGKYMARFVINEIRDYSMAELWVALAVVMEAIPFPMGLEILNEEMHTLRRSKPDQLFSVCREMVEGTNFGVAAALRMSKYFDNVARNDDFQRAVWREKSDQFEQMAIDIINDIESDHLLHILLTIPLYDTSESMSILSLALETNRIRFLNSDRILGIMKHCWYHSASIHVSETIDTMDQPASESLALVCNALLYFTLWTLYVFDCQCHWS